MRHYNVDLHTNQIANFEKWHYGMHVSIMMQVRHFSTNVSITVYLFEEKGTFIKYLPYLWSPIFSNTTSNIYVVCFQWRPTPREFAWNPETTCWKKDAMPRKSHRATWNAASATQTIVTLQPPWLLQFSRSFCAQWCQCFTIWCGEECLNQFKCGINEIQF